MNQINGAAPDLDLGTTYTAQDLNKANIKLNVHNPIYLMKYPYHDKKIDPITFVLFLSTLSEEDFKFTLKQSLNRTIDSNFVDCRIMVSQKLTFFHEEKEIFKIQFDSLGNYFFIQVLNTSTLIHYNEIKFKRSERKVDMFIYNFNYEYDHSLTTPYQIKFPPDIFHKISIIFNHKNVSKDVNQFTQMLFFRYSPFNPKTIRKNRFFEMNPDDDLYDIFIKHSGYIIYVKGDGPFKYKGESVKMFCWLHKHIINFIDQGTSCGLDCTFRVLKPYKACIPQCIVQNTGVPLGIAVGPQESSNLYSLVFELIFRIDKKVYSKFQKLPFITDEHTAFEKLSNDYHISIHKCFSHLIKSIGANSALALLFRDILYSYSEAEYEKNYLKNCYIFKQLYEIEDERTRDDTRFLKVGSVLGIDPKGNPIEKPPEYSLLYERIIKKVPTTNNHCESFHARINSIAADMRYSINNRLALVTDHIMNRLTHLDTSSVANLRNYLLNLKKRAIEKVKQNPDLLHNYSLDDCDCKYASYHSMLYDIRLPCIHMILNKQWENDLSEFLIHLSINKDDGEEPFLVDFEIDDPCPTENVIPNDLEQNEFVIHESVIQENKKYTDPIENLIYHCYRQLKRICPVDKIVVAGVVANVQQELLKDKAIVEKLESNYDEFLASLQVKTWQQIYEKYKLSKKF